MRRISPHRDSIGGGAITRPKYCPLRFKSPAEFSPWVRVVCGRRRAGDLASSMSAITLSAR
jgi:hypothetical protein